MSALCVALVTMACSSGAESKPKAVTGEEILLGAPLSLTGTQSTEGNLVKRGYDLWLDWVNQRGGIEVAGVRHKVQIRYQDDTSKADLSAQATRDLVANQRAAFLLGPYGSTNATPDAAVAQELKVPMVEGNAPAKAIYAKGNRYIFGAMAPTDKYMQGVLDMAATMNPRPNTIALLSADDAFSLEVAKATADYAGMKGMQVVSNQQYPNGSTNLFAQLTAAKQKNPDIVINSGHTVEAIAISKAARDIRLDAKIFAYTIGPTTPDFLQALGKGADYVVTGSQWSPDVKYRPAMYLSAADYVSAYQQKYATKDVPSYIAAQSTAVCLALQRALENARSLDREKVRTALAALDLITFYGRIKFDQTGLNVYKPMVVEQIQNGHRTTVWPQELAVASPAYPTPSWQVRLDLPPPPPPAKLPGTGHPGRK
jgi:branched-chain amino acid transport system substrate-binding protein